MYKLDLEKVEKSEFKLPTSVGLGSWRKQGSSWKTSTSAPLLLHPYGRKWRRNKETIDEIECGEWENWLKFNIQKTKIMAYSPITSWQIDGETVETVADFIFGGPKITADGDCSHEIKRHLLLGRNVMTNLDSILKSRDLCQQRSI